MELEAVHRRARERGVQPIVYWIVRAVLQPFFLVWFRLRRVGREHVPASGPVILAANHRSFLDPFVIATMARRPLYYVAKRELFAHRVQGWLLGALGAFPVDRGRADADMLLTAKAVLARGDAVLMFPEGTRIRSGSLGTPKRGVGRLALETGAPVVPVAVTGTEQVRRGWRIRPRRVQIRCGRPLTFPRVESASPRLAAAVTERIWPCVRLQWEWLGGLPPVRRAAVIGGGAWGTAVALTLVRAGLEVELGCRTRAQADAVGAARENARYLPGVELPAELRVAAASDLELGAHDLVLFAVPARELPGAVAAHASRIAPRAGVVVLSKGLVAPHARRPSEHVAERVAARAVAAIGGPAHADGTLRHGTALVVASEDLSFGRQLDEILRRAGHDVLLTDDVAGVELAGCAKNAAALAASAALAAGPNAAGAAAGKVWAEVDALARHRGARPETLAGVAGTGDLVATVLAAGSRNRRAGALLGDGVATPEIRAMLGQTAEALDGVGLLADALRGAGIPAPALDGLAGLVAGEGEVGSWVAGLTAPAPPTVRVRAA